MIVKVHGLGMGDSMVIKTDEIKAEMGIIIKRNMTMTLSETLILNQVDKIILPQSFLAHLLCTQKVVSQLPRLTFLRLGGWVKKETSN